MVAWIPIHWHSKEDRNVIITLSETTRIRGTSRCWQLERPRSKNGRTKWEPYKYFLTFRQALDKAGDDEVRNHPAKTIPEAIEAIADINRKHGELFGLHLPAAESHQSKIRRNMLGIGIV